jgi:hypothetical protein
MVGTCRSCKAPVWWVMSEKGKRAPIDIETTPDGNIEVDRASGVFRVVPSGSREGRTDLHKNHFVTCPQARDWSTKKRGGE